MPKRVHILHAKPRCVATGKVIYKLRDAEHQAERYWVNHKSRVRPYQCLACGQWHLGHYKRYDQYRERDMHAKKAEATNKRADNDSRKGMETDGHKD